MSVPAFDIFKVTTTTLPTGKIPATCRDIQKIFAGSSTKERQNEHQNDRAVFKKSEKTLQENL